MKLPSSNKKAPHGQHSTVTLAKLGGMLSNNDNALKLIPEDAEDIWLLYNILRVGDAVSASTYRKVSVGV